MTGSGSRTPGVSRIYDALLGGKDKYAEDWQAARTRAPGITSKV
jgi:hypothetical protein